MKRKCILIIGGVSYQDTEYPRIGGTTILMDNFIDYCDNHNVPYIFVSSNKYYGRFSSIMNTFSLIKNLFIYINKVDIVMVNISSLRGTYTLFPFVFYIAKLFRKSIIFRKFAGNLHLFLDKNPVNKKLVIYYLKRCNLCFFETKYLMKYFNNYGIKTAWFPNVRNVSISKKDKASKYERKFVFASHILKTKGIDELLECFKLLGPAYRLDIYGELKEYKEEDLRGLNYCYKGLLKSKDVVDTICQYDCLLLPSYSEGYPGIIIEALSVGLPIIATRVGGIPEIIENNVNGLLISPKNVNELKEAIVKFDRLNHNDLSINALSSFDENFNSNIINPKIVELILNV